MSQYVGQIAIRQKFAQGLGIVLAYERIKPLTLKPGGGHLEKGSRIGTVLNDAEGGFFQNQQNAMWLYGFDQMHLLPVTVAQIDIVRQHDIETILICILN